MARLFPTRGVLVLDAAFEIDIVQNPALAAELLWHAVAECCARTDGLKGLSLPTSFLVLPIAMHRRSAAALTARKGPGSFQRTIAEVREFSVGLQERSEALASKTLAAMNLGFAADLFSLERTRLQLFWSRRTRPVEHVTESVARLVDAARRMGHAAAELDFPQLATLLGIRL
jgi:hypothetical protein